MVIWLTECSNVIYYNHTRTSLIGIIDNIYTSTKGSLIIHITHMEIGPCTYFSLPPPSSWQMQCLQGMGSYLVSPASVTTTLSLFYSQGQNMQLHAIILDGSHIKLLLKASHLCILVNSHECGNGCLQLMGRHTCVPTCDVVIQSWMNTY